MPATKQSQAVQVWNAMLSLAAQCQTLDDALATVLKQYANDGASTTWGAWPTTALNADGSSGAADASPTAGHPVDASKIPGLNRVTDAQSMTTLVSNLQLLQGFFDGTGSSIPVVNRRQAIDPLVGG